MALLGPARVMQMVKKGPWSEMEDQRLLDLVNYHGAESWMDISKEHGSRNAKQCRERYHQNLKSSINRGPITPEEGVAIERLHTEKGPKWAEIARALGGRSDNQVKNWYNGQKNRRTKMNAHGGQVALQGAQHSLSALRPVDAQVLQQRGHINPYATRSVDHLPRFSPTTSQISEAPSLISDASSTSPGMSPSPNTIYPAQPNLSNANLTTWSEDSLRPVLPPLCSALPSTSRGNPLHLSIAIQPVNPPYTQTEQADFSHIPNIGHSRTHQFCHEQPLPPSYAPYNRVPPPLVQQISPPPLQQQQQHNPSKYADHSDPSRRRRRPSYPPLPPPSAAPHQMTLLEPQLGEYTATPCLSLKEPPLPSAAACDVTTLPYSPSSAAEERRPSYSRPKSRATMHRFSPYPSSQRQASAAAVAAAAQQQQQQQQQLTESLRTAKDRMRLGNILEQA
ncbi:MAG: hypothetical protein Q9191_007737 [Dirinaria sp. TL-2023a]